MAVLYRHAEPTDVPALARIRAAEWGDEDYWRRRISGYLAEELHPGQALKPRVIYVALEDDVIVGFIAGHLTRRYGCQGELEWINVISGRRRNAVASQLLRRLAAWFIEHKALRVCVDVEPANAIARSFYARHGARTLKPHWLVWSDINVVLD